ncbi:hypothetical protein DRJ22_02655 [Candidatus Woesearchaeota archaeon]|nr:MAG: hypothetical protein B6U93_00050 [Candidatus Woesearchaeota archaeon ex4484_78]RLE46155.1 MAG: hypothetical protein DRJ22_02655 [Candidatus Woesearchaeota archaeon]
MKIKHKKQTYIICGILLVISILGIMLLKNNEPRMAGHAVIQQETIQAKQPTAENALESLLEAEDDLKEMQEQGLSTFFIQDTLLKAKRKFIGKNKIMLESLMYGRKQGLKKKYLEHLTKIYETTPEHELEDLNYAETIKLTDLIKEKKLQAYKIIDTLDLLKEKEKEYRAEGADTIDAVELLGKAKKEFKEERYDNAEKFLKQADSGLETAHAELLKTKEIWNSINFLLEKYGIYLLISITIITIIIHFIKKKVIE